MSGSSYHLRKCNETFLENLERLCPELRGIPDNKISQFSDFNTTDRMADALGQRRIDGVFADVALDPPVVCSSPFILRQRTSLELVLVRGSPRRC